MTIRFFFLLGAVALPALAMAQAAPGVVAKGNAVTGAKLFLQCRACHTVAPSDASEVGPNLSGVVGAKAATKPDYAYSAALKAANIVWTQASLDAWLKKPTALVPGTRMAFAGMPSPQARADIIAYLTTLKPAKRRP